jgi:hypothetical protein
MNRLFRGLPWFLLVPYFAVANLNLSPWFGGSRENANRTNAQLTVALILVSPVLYVLAWAGHVSDRFPKTHPFIFAVLLFVPLWLVVSAWLTSDREAEYRMDYMAMSRPARLAFGVATAALVGVGWWLTIPPA